MKLSLVAVALCVGVASASVLRAAPEVPEVPEVKKPKVPEAKVPDAKVPDAKVPEVKKPKVPEAKVPEAEVPDVKKPKVPEAKVPEGEVPEVKKPKVPEAKVPEGEVPEVEKPKVPEAKVPEAKVPEAKVPEAEVPETEVPEVEKPKVPPVKCGPTKPWSEHTAFEPDVDDVEDMCKACKIRACNAKLPMPGDGGKACRCQYSIPSTCKRLDCPLTTDCKPPFADGVDHLGDWHNCPGEVRNCEELEGQCVSATFKMDSAPEEIRSGAASKTMMPLAALALFYLA